MFILGCWIIQYILCTLCTSTYAHCKIAQKPCVYPYLFNLINLYSYSTKWRLSLLHIQWTGSTAIGISRIIRINDGIMKYYRIIREHYECKLAPIETRSRIHERTISSRFLGTILRVLRLEVSVYNVYITNQSQNTFARGGGGGGV